jgi:hypothetical protein
MLSVLATPARTTENGIDAPTWLVAGFIVLVAIGFIGMLVVRSRNRRK